MIAPGAITPFWIGSGQMYSTDVQEAMDNYTGLSAKDLALINSIITNLGSNYDLIDEIFLFVLGSNVEANGSIGLKGTVGDNSSGGTFDIGGNLFNGVDEFFDTTITPSTDFTQASQDNTDVQCFVTDNLDTGTVSLFGANDGTESLTLLTIEPNHRAQVNSDAPLLNNIDGGVYQDETLYGIRRDDSGNQEFFINGLLIESEPDARTGLSTIPVFVGARNAGGAAASFLNAKLAIWSAEAAVGFDNALFNTVIRNSLTAYGTI